MNLFYILNENKNLVECDYLTWGEWFENFENRLIKFTQFEKFAIDVSTVCMGIPLYFSRENEKPKLFETMVFKDGELLDRYIERYSTYQEALEGHQEVVKEVNKFIRNKKT